VNLSIGAQAFLLELGTGSDGIDAMSAVFMIESWGVLPEDILPEVSRLKLVMSLHEPDGQEIIFLSASGLRYIFEISERIRSHSWFRN